MRRFNIKENDLVWSLLSSTPPSPPPFQDEGIGWHVCRCEWLDPGGGF